MNRRVFLKEVCERIDYGLTTSATLVGNGPKFLRITDIDRSFIDWSAVPRCQASGHDLDKYSLSNGDVVVARTGASTGRSQWVEVTEPSVFASYLVRFRVRSDIDSRFIGYVLNSTSWFEHVSSVAHGKSAQPNMSASEMARFEFTCPPLSEQRAIAEVLGALDDKIAANTKLATDASTLVQLEFHRLMKVAQTPVVLGDLLALDYGKSLPATKRVPGAVPVYGSGGIVGTHAAALCSGPGVVVGRKGTAGAVHWSPTPFFPIDTTYWVRPLKDDVSPVFAYFLLKSLRLDEMNSDSAVPGLNRNEALAIPARCPEPTELQSFTEEAMELFDVSAQMDHENRVLATTRDTLLPQLMSGKLRVKDAESVVGSLA